MKHELSIGDLARDSGISVDTLRVWERRYGHPVPKRLPSGHRRYGEIELRRMRKVAELLALGHRPASVVPLDEAELDRLLGGEHAPELASTIDLEHLFELVGQYDRAGLWRELSRASARMAAPELILEFLAPILQLVGRRWTEGALRIRHEHFLSEVIEDFLRDLRQAVAAPGGETILLTTLGEERHGIGIHFAAVFASLAGWHPVVLGTECPLPEIVAAVEECEAAAVGLSVSLASGGVATDRELAELRGQLPDHVPLIVGGAGARGARRGPRGILYPETLKEFESYLRELVAR